MGGAGNVPAVIADIGEVTINQLRDFGIPYHEICFGKPYAHFYVDDLAVRGRPSPPRAAVGIATTQSLFVTTSHRLPVISLTGYESLTSLLGSGSTYW